MKWNFKWGKNNKQEMTPELTERNVNVYKHENKIKGAEHLGQIKCAVCGKWFTPTHHRQKTCSDECRKARAKQQYDSWHERALRGKPPVVYKGKCVVCGNKFETTYKQQVTCSKECSVAHKQKKKKEWQQEHYQELYDRYKRKKQDVVETASNNERKENDMEIETIMRGNKPWTPPVKVCPTCGKKFVATSNRQLFCSDECRDKAYALKKDGVELPRRTPGGYISTAPSEPRKCDICGKEFMPRTKKQRYCSKECGAEAMRRCTRKWHQIHETRSREYQKPRVTSDVYLETANVVAKLVKSGVDDDIVAKYLHTVFGGK